MFWIPKFWEEKVSISLYTTIRCLDHLVHLRSLTKLLDPMPISELLKVTTENLLYIAELSIAYLAAKHSKPTGLMYHVKEVPLEKRINKHIRYAFWAPIGLDGFFMQ